MTTKSVLKIILISSIAVLISGCQSLNSRFGNDRSDYVNAKEEKALKMPAGSLALSDRYEIPTIPGNQDKIITDLEPPTF